jgi:hypothetical protein
MIVPGGVGVERPAPDKKLGLGDIQHRAGLAQQFVQGKVLPGPIRIAEAMFS